jgi:hypothetical protein
MTTPRPKYHILLLEGRSQYGANNRFAQDLHTALETSGHTVTRTHFDASEFVSVITQVLQAPTAPLDLVINFNGIAKELIINDQIFYQLLDIPCINYFVDHPFKQMNRIDLPIQQMINTYVDETHIPAAKKLLSTQFTGISGCLKHAGSSLSTPSVPFEQRERKILMAGSYKPFDACWQELTIPNSPPLTQLLQRIVEAHIADPITLPMGERFIQAFTDAAVPLERLEQNLVCHLFMVVEKAIEMHFREGFMKAAKELPLIVAGNGWEQFQHPSPTWELLGTMPFDWMLERMQQVQLVWSMVYCFTHGGHERIFYAQANGAAVACDAMPWLQTQYQDTQSALLLEPNAFEAGAEKLAFWLTPAQQPALAKLAQAGQSVCLAHHTWQHRVAEIEALVAQYHATT